MESGTHVRLLLLCVLLFVVAPAMMHVCSCLHYECDEFVLRRVVPCVYYGCYNPTFAARLCPQSNADCFPVCHLLPPFTSAFFRSYPTTVFMNVPYAAVVVSTNETLKKILQPEDGAPSLPVYMFCGAVSGAAAAAVTNPLDVVKTRLQTQNCVLSASGTPACTSTRTCATSLVVRPCVALHDAAAAVDLMH